MAPSAQRVPALHKIVRSMNFDVWFDSGSSNLPSCMADARRHLSRRPDQYRAGSKVRCSLPPELEMPRFPRVVTHGWTLDEQGRPMSKSLATSSSRRDLRKMGWPISCACGSPRRNIKPSKDERTGNGPAQQELTARFATFRFALGNWQIFDPSEMRYLMTNGRNRSLDAGSHRGAIPQMPRMVADMNFHRV